METNTETENTTTTTTIPLPTALPWGLRDVVPPDARIAWGARAIYRLDHTPARYRKPPGGGRAKCIARSSTTAQIDCVWDRQGTGAVADITERESKALQRWLNAKGLPALRRACVKEYITGDSEAVVTIERDGYKLVASPRASYGYLYIAAWKVPS